MANFPLAPLDRELRREVRGTPYAPGVRWTYDLVADRVLAAYAARPGGQGGSLDPEASAALRSLLLRGNRDVCSWSARNPAKLDLEYALSPATEQDLARMQAGDAGELGHWVRSLLADPAQGYQEQVTVSSRPYSSCRVVESIPFRFSVAVRMQGTRPTRLLKRFQWRPGDRRNGEAAEAFLAFSESLNIADYRPQEVAAAIRAILDDA